VILGIPFGADRATAERAYAQRSRLARKGDYPFSVDDIIWAINQVESHLDDPTTSATTYRLPAQPEAMRRPGGHGLFRPPLLPLPRRTPPTTPDQVGAVLDEARKDALDHLLGRAASDVRRRYALGGDAGPIRPAPLNRYPRRARSKVPLVAGFVGVLALAAAVGGFLYLRDKAKEVSIAPTTTLAPVVTTTPPTTAAPTTTTEPPAPGLGDALVRDGIALTPVQPVDVSGHLCLLFMVDGQPPLNFVPAEAVLISDQLIEPDLAFTSGRATSDVVYGEPAPTTREICWPIVDWRTKVTELLYTLNDTEYRWTISNGAGG
jgi:hypothetical protein